MVRKSLLLLPALLLAACGSQQEEGGAYPRIFQVDRSNIWLATSAADGNLYGTTNTSPQQLVHWEQGAWKELCPLPEKALRLFPTQGNGLWITCQQRSSSALSLYRWTPGDTEPALVSRFPAPLGSNDVGSMRMHETEQGQLLFTARGILYGLDLAKKPYPEFNLLYTVPMDALWKNWTIKPNGRWNPMVFTPDREGNLWIWSNAGQGGSNLRSMRGLLKFKNGEIEYLAEIQGLPEGGWFALEPLPEGTLACSIFKEGLFRITPNNSNAEPIAIPDEIKTEPILDLFIENGSLWMISGAHWRPQVDSNGLTGVLWRQEDQGGWQQIINGLDRYSPFDKSIPRIHHSEKNGFWLGSYGQGLIWIPKNKNPRFFSWPEGQTAESPALMVQQQDRLVLWNREKCTVEFHPKEARALPPAPPSCPMWYLHSDQNITRSDSGEVYAILGRAHGEPIRRWTGDGWEVLDYPDDSKALHDCTLANDSLERLWVIPKNDTEPARIWDPAAKQWLDPVPYRELLIRESESPSFNFTFQVANVANSRQAIFGTDGTIAYPSSYGRSLEFFDGTAWKSLEAQKMGSGYAIRDLKKHTETGRICVLFGNSKWLEYNGDNAWIECKLPPGPIHYAFGRWASQEERNQVRDIQGPYQSTIVTSESGTLWFSGQNNLWRAIDSMTASWFTPEDPPNPFCGGRQAIAVFKDKWGNDILLTNLSNGREWIRLSPRTRKPETINIEASAPDAIAISTSAQSGRLKWRMNEDPWSIWLPAEDQLIENLLPGTYKIEAQYLDEHLNEYPSLEKTIALHYEPSALVKDAIDSLFSNDWGKRRSAVRVFARFPGLAEAGLKTLQEKQSTLDDTDRWWLDAAEQAVQRARSQADDRQSDQGSVGTGRST